MNMPSLIYPSAPPRLVAATAVLSLLLATSSAQAVERSVDAYYNPNEERGSFDMVMKPYPIPVVTTTYDEFAFNLPEDVPDVFHAVLAEAIISQPEHLHHTIIQGCSKRIDASLEGLPAAETILGMDCTQPLGGYAPGGYSLFGNVDTGSGILLGRGVGIAAIKMAVHYTDGEYEDAATRTQKMAEDGLRVHYTPDFRPYSTTYQHLLHLAGGADRMAIPPGEPRFYITRTCKVGASCKDFSPAQLGRVAGTFLGGLAPDGEIPCTSPLIRPMCGADGPLRQWVQRFCPATCGFCAEAPPDGAANPFLPASYRVTAINYHAHLLGREMYATLLRDGAEAGIGDVAVLKNAPVTVTEDLASQEFWIIDNQVTFPIEKETVRDDDALPGVDVRPGDRIQVTCVYDSTMRDRPTKFNESTYDEMCITTSLVTFPTPASLVGGGGTRADGATLDVAVELSLLTFNCDEDDETDVHVGTLAEDEDARDIWRDHPIGDAEGCTFPQDPFSLVAWQTMARCPPSPGPGAGSGEDSDREPEGESVQGRSDDEDDSSAAPALAGRSTVLTVLVCVAAALAAIHS